MLSDFDIVPVDTTTIQTRLRIHPELFADPASFVHNHDLPIRTMKPTRGRSADGPTENLTLHVLTYRGITVKLTRTAAATLTSAKIDFNPGVCLYGHNGGIISLSEFLDALAVLVTHLKRLLVDPDDWYDLVPGVRRGGRAYWSYLEIFLHRLDPGGALLSNFRHARHPSVRTPTRHWPTSIQIGGKRSTIQFSIYHKAIEMVARGKLPKSDLSKFADILRLEARMHEDKLVLYFGNEHNVEEIDETERLVRFFHHDLVGGLRRCFSEMEGVYRSPGATSVGIVSRKPNEALGRMLAVVSLDAGTTRSLPELLSLVEFYTGASLSATKKAARAELSRRSSLSYDDLFSDAAYHSQPGITIPDIEQKIRHELMETHPHRLINAAYRPPDSPFRPLTQWPGYLRA